MTEALGASATVRLYNGPRTPASATFHFPLIPRSKALKSREGGLLSELESLTKKDVIIKSDPTVHQERFEIY